MCAQGIGQAEIATKFSCIIAILSDVETLETAVHRPLKLSSVGVLPNSGRKGAS